MFGRLIISQLELGLLKRDPTKMSLARKRKKAARDDEFLKSLLSQLDSWCNCPRSVFEMVPTDEKAVIEVEALFGHVTGIKK